MKHHLKKKCFAYFQGKQQGKKFKRTKISFIGDSTIHHVKVLASSVLPRTIDYNKKKMTGKMLAFNNKIQQPITIKDLDSFSKSYRKFLHFVS